MSGRLGDSENEDDPQVYESSGEEWVDDTDVQKKRTSRRISTRNAKKIRSTVVDDSSGDNSSSEEVKPKKRNGVNKRQKVEGRTANTLPKVINSPEFSTGSFLILKKDVQVGDKTKHPAIWRVDGKALLQKYEPFEDDGKIRHRTTSVYTGWSVLDRDLYAPVQVMVYRHANHSMVVELNWDQLKTIDMDSD